MGRPPALTPEQEAEVRRRVASGEGLRALAREFKVSDGTIRRISAQSTQVKKVAEKLAEAQAALAALPVAHQHDAVALAEKLRRISASLASAAELGAATAHRLQALANTEVAKIDDAQPFTSMESLKGVKVLTDLANGAAAISLNLLAANKERVQKLDEPPPDEQAPMRPTISREEWLKLHG